MKISPLTKLSDDHLELVSELVFRQYRQPYKIVSVTEEDGETSVVVRLKDGRKAEVQFPRKIIVKLSKSGKDANK